MTKRLYFGNLSWDVDDQQLAQEVSRHGSVISATVVSDRETGRSRGFGFVEMEDGDAQKVIEHRLARACDHGKRSARTRGRPWWQWIEVRRKRRRERRLYLSAKILADISSRGGF